MCGIVGMAGNLNISHGKMFRDMLIFDSVRGIDSTGVVKVPLKYASTDNTPIMEKDIGLPNNLWELNVSKIFDYKGFPKTMGRAFIGHNRAATVGKINVANAHPFNFGSVYGVHNGSLRYYKDLEGYTEHEVDSMCLLQTIAEKGIVHTWKNFTGAAALVWWDDEEQKLNIIRNDERPLWVAYSTNNDAIFWASEEWMIECAAARRGVKLKKIKNEKTGLEEIDFRYFKPDHHYVYEVTSTSVKCEKSELLEKKHFPPASSNKNTTKAGFVIGHANNKKGGYRLKRKQKQLNAGWANGMEKAPKELRGVHIRLTAQLDNGLHFLASFKDAGTGGIPSGPISIYPNSNDAREQLQKALHYGNVMFKTTARMRMKVGDSHTSYAISSAGIKPIITLVHSKDDDGGNDEEKPKNLYCSYKGVYVDAATWKNLLSPACGPSCSCIWCGDPLDINDHEKILYLSKEDAMCPECAKDDLAVSSIGYTYPELNFSKEG